MGALTTESVVGKLHRLILVLLLMTSLCLISGANRSSAVQIGAAVSGGYDSNAVLSDKPICGPADISINGSSLPWPAGRTKMLLQHLIHTNKQ